MNPEIVEMRNALSGARKKVTKLREETFGALLIVRQNLPVYGDDAILRADTNKALEYCKRLHELKSDLVKTLATIKQLEEALGESNE